MHFHLKVKFDTESGTVRVCSLRKRRGRARVYYLVGSGVFQLQISLPNERSLSVLRASGHRRRGYIEISVRFYQFLQFLVAFGFHDVVTFQTGSHTVQFIGLLVPPQGRVYERHEIIHGFDLHKYIYGFLQIFNRFRVFSQTIKN